MFNNGNVCMYKADYFKVVNITATQRQPGVHVWEVYREFHSILSFHTIFLLPPRFAHSYCLTQCWCQSDSHNAGGMQVCFTCIDIPQHSHFVAYLRTLHISSIYSNNVSICWNCKGIWNLRIKRRNKQFNLTHLNLLGIILSKLQLHTSILVYKKWSIKQLNRMYVCDACNP